MPLILATELQGEIGYKSGALASHVEYQRR